MSCPVAAAWNELDARRARRNGFPKATANTFTKHAPRQAAAETIVNSNCIGLSAGQAEARERNHSRSRAKPSSQSDQQRRF